MSPSDYKGGNGGSERPTAGRPLPAVRAQPLCAELRSAVLHTLRSLRQRTVLLNGRTGDVVTGRDPPSQSRLDRQREAPWGPTLTRGKPLPVTWGSAGSRVWTAESRLTWPGAGSEHVLGMRPGAGPCALAGFPGSASSLGHFPGLGRSRARHGHGTRQELSTPSRVLGVGT